mgnify:CR=1 FL=1
MNLVGDEDAPIQEIKENFKYFKSVNRYVIEYNSLIPETEVLFANADVGFRKSEIIWIESVFNGKDFDNAYKKAKKLAHDEDWDRALLLCRYILKQIPRHADTEILIGRIYAWQKKYDTSIDILEKCVQKYPTYADGYAALLDVYFWADQNEKAIELKEMMVKNNIVDEEIKQKMTRARDQIRKGTAQNAGNPKEKNGLVSN